MQDSTDELPTVNPYADERLEYAFLTCTWVNHCIWPLHVPTLSYVYLTRLGLWHHQRSCRDHQQVCQWNLAKQQPKNRRWSVSWCLIVQTLPQESKSTITSEAQSGCTCHNKNGVWLPYRCQVGAPVWGHACTKRRAQTCCADTCPNIAQGKTYNKGWTCCVKTRCHTGQSSRKANGETWDEGSSSITSSHDTPPLRSLQQHRRTQADLPQRRWPSNDSRTNKVPWQRTSLKFFQLENAILDSLVEKTDDEIYSMIEAIKQDPMFPKFAQEQIVETGLEDWSFDDVCQIPTWEIWHQKFMAGSPHSTSTASVPTPVRKAGALHISPPPKAAVEKPAAVPPVAPKSTMALATPPHHRSRWLCHEPAQAALLALGSPRPPLLSRRPNQAVLPEDRPSCPEDRPCSPEDRPCSPEDRPCSPEDRPCSPEDRPCAPEDQQCCPEDHPCCSKDKFRGGWIYVSVCNWDQAWVWSGLAFKGFSTFFLFYIAQRYSMHMLLFPPSPVMFASLPMSLKVEPVIPDNYDSRQAMQADFKRRHYWCAMKYQHIFIIHSR